VGAKVTLGDMKREWAESVEAANRAGLKQLDAELKAWFDKKYPKNECIKAGKIFDWMGDRFAHQAKAQLRAVMLAADAGGK